MTHNAIELVEVGPRDGLQNEPDIISTQSKLELSERMLGYGARRLEVASFVHPKRVPQMADAEDVIAGLPDRAVPANRLRRSGQTRRYPWLHPDQPAPHRGRC
mgnify:CR=1 FL=1